MFSLIRNTREPLPFALLLATLAGCSGTSGLPSDAGPADAIADSKQPPDVWVGSDARVTPVGARCDVAASQPCSDGLTCLDVGLGVGICGRTGCVLEDLDTAKREDDCDQDSACAEIPVEDGSGQSTTKTFCLPKCTPALDGATAGATQCEDGIACDPLSLFFSGYTEVCLFPTCKKDGDCGNRNELDPDSYCDVGSGVCFNLGNNPQQAPVGFPCKVSLDCDRGLFCLPERQSNGETRVHGGYCTVVGCGYGGPWTCPADNSSCFSLGSSSDLSLCLQTGCNPTNPPESDGCRDKAPNGQYKCVDVNDEHVCWLDLGS